MQDTVRPSRSKRQRTSSLRNPLRAIRKAQFLPPPRRAPPRGSSSGTRGSAASGAPVLGRRRGGLCRSRGLPGLGPRREPGRRGFAVGRRDVAPLHARELPALLDQLQELRQAHRGGGCGRGRGVRARAAPTAGPLHAGPLSLTRVRSKRFRVGWVQPPSEGMKGGS